MKRILQTTVILLVPFFLFSQELGKIAGTVTDEATGEPLIGANILVEGTSFGAATDSEGQYRILGVPVSVYTVRAEFIGYRAIRLSIVRVAPGLTTTADFAMTSEALELGTVEVLAERPLVSMSATNAVRSVDSEIIGNVATRNVADLMNLQAGVVVDHGRVHVRGSRPSEVGFELEGAPTRGLALVEGLGTIQSGFAQVSINTGGTSIWNLSPTIPEALEQVTLQSGGYGADLGGANAGIIQQKLKTGGSRLSAKVLYETDAMAADIGGVLDDFLGSEESYSYGQTDMTVTLGGPLLTNRIRFFGAYQQLRADDYAPQWWSGASIQGGDSLVSTTASGDPTDDRIVVEWDGGKVEGRSSERDVFNGTLLLDFNPLILRLGLADSKSSTKMVGNYVPAMFNLDRQPVQDDESRLMNLKATFFLSDNTLFNFNVNSSHYYRYRYDPLFGKPDDLVDVLLWGDSAEVAARGYPDAYSSRYIEADDYIVEEFQFQLPGTLNTAYRKDLQDYIGFNGGMVSQMNAHEIKLGFDYRKYTIRRYNLFLTRILSLNQSIDQGVISLSDITDKTETGKATLRQQRVRAIGYDEFGDELDEGIFGARHPTTTSFYFNDKIEMKDIVVNIGLRYDDFALDDAAFDDVDNPAYDRNRFGVFEDSMHVAEAKSVLQPRLGLAFPLSDRTVFHLQYGKFAQFPELSTTYKGPGAIAGTFGAQNYVSDPVAFDLDPVVTNQFEVGFSYEFIDGAAFDITAFTRNTVGQITQAHMEPTGGWENRHNVGQLVAVYVNGDFAAATGVEFSLVTRRLNRLQAMFNYTWTDARGTNSYANSLAGVLNYTSTFAPVPTMISPLLFQLKHKGTVNIDYRFGEDEGGILANTGFNVLFTFNSGHPYTNVKGGFGQRGADEGALLNMTDTRQRIPVEPIGNSTTPWVFNTDLRITKGLTLAGATVDAYIIITNLFNRKHVMDVYGRTGDAFDDGFLTTPELSETILGNHTEVYRELYEAVNLEHRTHYRRDMGADLFGVPRQIRVGFGVSF